jgi:hypothetical protein
MPGKIPVTHLRVFCNSWEHHRAVKININFDFLRAPVIPDRRRWKSQRIIVERTM